jgi:transcriptional regulator with XRE-family HTH domain
LAERTGVPQSTIGRIEIGAIDPRASTLDRLLRACHFELEALPSLGEGIDRSQIRDRLRLSPRERIEAASGAAAAVARIRGRARKSRSRA